MINLTKKNIISLAVLALLVVPATALAQSTACTPGTGASINLCNGFGTAGSVDALLRQLFTAVGTIVGTLAVLMLVVSGVRMMLSQGDPTSLTTAKTGFFWSIIGLMGALLSFVVVFALSNFIGVSNVPGVGSGTIENPLGSPDVQSFMVRIIMGILGFGGALAVVMLIINALRYITGAGNDEIVKKAKNGMLWSVVGFVTILLSYAILAIIRNAVISGTV